MIVPGDRPELGWHQVGGTRQHTWSSRRAAGRWLSLVQRSDRPSTGSGVFSGRGTHARSAGSSPAENTFLISGAAQARGSLLCFDQREIHMSSG